MIDVLSTVVVGSAVLLLLLDISSVALLGVSCGVLLLVAGSGTLKTR